MHWNKNAVILTTFNWLVALVIVKTTTSNTDSNDNFVFLTFPFQCQLICITFWLYHNRTSYHNGWYKYWTNCSGRSKENHDIKIRNLRMTNIGHIAQNTCTVYLSFGWHLTLLNVNQPRYQGSWGQHGAHLGPRGPRWAPCWPHELYSLRSYHMMCLCAGFRHKLVE